MNRKHALAVAAAAFLAAPVFAQSNACTLSSDNLQMTCPSTTILGAGPVMSSSGTVVTSGTGLVVTPGAPSSTVVVAPGSRVLPGASNVQASQTTILGGPAAGGIASSQTIVTRYWVNVPAGVEGRSDFQRWMNLKP